MHSFTYLSSLNLSFWVFLFIFVGSIFTSCLLDSCRRASWRWWKAWEALNWFEISCDAAKFKIHWRLRWHSSKRFCPGNCVIRNFSNLVLDLVLQVDNSTSFRFMDDVRPMHLWIIRSDLHFFSPVWVFLIFSSLGWLTVSFSCIFLAVSQSWFLSSVFFFSTRASGFFLGSSISRFKITTGWRNVSLIRTSFLLVKVWRDYEVCRRDDLNVFLSCFFE